MSLTRLFALMVLTGIVLAGCTGNAPRTLTEKDAGKIIELQQGDTLLVALEGNMTTGYTWLMQPANHPLLEQVGEPQVTPSSQLIGAGGVIALRFKAVNSGQAALRLVYARPWETDVLPEKTFEVTVVVK